MFRTMKANIGKYLISNPQLITFGLKFNLISKDEIIAWADEQILLQSHPDYFLIELSMLGNKHVSEIISLIDNRVGKELDRSTVQSIFRLIYVKLLDGSISPEVAIRAVIEFHYSHVLSSDENSDISSVMVK